jgi:hypothetical protein
MLLQKLNYRDILKLKQNKKDKKMKNTNKILVVALCFLSFLSIILSSILIGNIDSQVDLANASPIYSCPNGGSLSGSNCVFTPIPKACPDTTPFAPTPTPNGLGECEVNLTKTYGPLTTGADPIDTNGTTVSLAVPNYAVKAGTIRNNWLGRSVVGSDSLYATGAAPDAGYYGVADTVSAGMLHYQPRQNLRFAYCQRSGRPANNEEYRILFWQNSVINCNNQPGYDPAPRTPNVSPDIDAIGPHGSDNLIQYRYLNGTRCINQNNLDNSKYISSGWRFSDGAVPAGGSNYCENNNFQPNGNQFVNDMDTYSLSKFKVRYCTITGGENRDEAYLGNALADCVNNDNSDGILNTSATEISLAEAYPQGNFSYTIRTGVSCGSGFTDNGNNTCTQNSYPATVTGYSPLTNADITSASCVPSPSNFGTVVNCTANFAAGVSGTVSFDSPSNIGTCTTPEITATATSASCSITPNNTGTFQMTASASGSTPATISAGSITVNSVPVIISELTFVCPPVGSNLTVLVNSTTTCSFVLPTGKNLPAGFKVGIGDATPAGTCTATGQNVTCTGVPTGSLTGQQPIFGQIGTAAKEDSGEKANVTGSPFTDSEIDDMTFVCGTVGSNIVTNSTTTCTFNLLPGKTLPAGFKLGIGDSTPGGTCTLTNPDTAQVTCTGVPTGSQNGNQPIFGQIGTNAKVATGEFATVGGVPLTPPDIPDLTIVCPATAGQPVLVNSTTTCSFILPPGKTLPPDFKVGIGDATPAGTCALSANNSVVCTGVPTGSQTGQQPIFGQIGTTAKVDSGEKANVTGTPLVPEDLPNLADLKCIDGGRTFSFTTCSFTMPAGKTLPPDLKFGIGDSVPGGTCSLVNQNNVPIVTCVSVPTGSTAGLMPIFGQIGTSAKIDTGKKVYVIDSRQIVNIELCDPGEYLVGNNCVICPKGYYCQDGKTRTECPAGYTTQGEGAKYNTDCNVKIETKCMPGQFLELKQNGEGVCTTCPAGYYCDGNSAPKICPKGYYCPEGSVNPTACPSGYTTAKEGAKSVEECNVKILAGKAVRTGGIDISAILKSAILISVMGILGISIYMKQYSFESDWKKLK